MKIIASSKSSANLARHECGGTAERRRRFLSPTMPANATARVPPKAVSLVVALPLQSMTIRH
jgi:hypothetical protein